jgi:hypothetical protein
MLSVTVALKINVLPVPDVDGVLSVNVGSRVSITLLVLHQYD